MIANPKVEEREVPRDLFAIGPGLLANRSGQVILAEDGYASAEFEASLATKSARLVRRAKKVEAPRRGARFLKPLRQLVESVDQTLNGQLDLERHGGHTPEGVGTRVLERLPALTAAFWHNHQSGHPVLRSLICL